MKKLLTAIALIGLIFSVNTSAAEKTKSGKGKKAAKIALDPKEQAEREKRLIEAGEKFFREKEKQPSTPMPKNLREKMQSSVPKENE